MKLIVGLGNPGLEYRFTRHNAGFWVVDALATTSGAQYFRSAKLHCDTARLTLQGQDLLLIKPDTYMNLSGKAVAAALNWYKCQLCDLLVVHDDVSMPLGKLRYQKGGGAGGQHGIESIIEHLGEGKSFDRLKVGVGPDPGGQRRADYVLSPLSENEKQLAESIVGLAAKSLSCWAKDGTQACMNQFNGEDLRDKDVIEAEKRARKKASPAVPSEIPRASESSTSDRQSETPATASKDESSTPQISSP